MMEALRGVGAWPLYAAVLVVAALVLARLRGIRGRRERAIQREVERLRRELADREALESQDHFSP